MAPGCHNREGDTKIRKTLQFHRLPLKKPLLLKKWLGKLKLKYPSITKSSRICSDHFSPECYIRDLQSELLGLDRSKKLKDNAVPTIFDFSGYAKQTDVPSTSSATSQRSIQRSERVNERNKKKESQQVSYYPQNDVM